MDSSPKFWQTLLLMQLAVMAIVITSAYLGMPVIEYKKYDVLMHFLLFGSTSYLAYRASNRRKEVFFTRFILPFWPVVILLLSCFEECLQLLSTHRTFSLLDMSSNIIGVCFFYLMDELWLRWSFANK